MNAPQLYVLTGGPGSGKTTLLTELARRGFRCVPEVARVIIQEQMQTSGVALPWLGRRRYTEIMLERSIAAFLENATIQETTFFDRGIPDTLCYARLVDLEEVQAATASGTYRYATKVFAAPPWPAIYVTDKERKQSFAEADQDLRSDGEGVRGSRVQGAGITLCSVEERAEFVLQNLGQKLNAK